MPTPPKMQCVGLGPRGADLAPGASWRQMGSCDHFVQFYEEDAFLVESVAGFVAEGLGRGEAAVVIATRAHCDALAAHLEQRSIDVIAAEKSGQYQAVDAAEALSRLMLGARPDRQLFNESVGGIVRRAARHWPAVRAFGEMVALLWEEGNGDAAIELEELWNELGRDQAFALFCAYPMRGFRRTGDGVPLAHICRTHTRVIPAESYAGQESWEERLRSITALQQKASALELEIQERHRAELAQHAEKTKLEIAAAAAQLGWWEYDLVTEAFVASSECKAHFGFGPGEPIDFAAVVARIHPDDQAAANAGIRQSVQGGIPYAAEYRVVHANGEMRWIAATGRVVHNGSHHLLGVTIDVTDRRRAAEKLEQMVALRTAQLSESLAELEAFSYSVSHDMRAPLRAMQGYAKAILDDFGATLEPEAIGNLQRIQRAAVRLDLLVRDVLAYSKLAKSALELEPISLDAILDDLVAQQSESARRCIHVERPLHVVQGHEACLAQCLANFLTNALKFTEPGVPPDVRVRSERVGDRVRLSVSDSGVGIHPDHYGRVFEMFGRVYSEKRFEGTGMGLAIAKKAVARMGGEIGFTSALGRGSTFWFTLPHGKNDD